MKFGIKCLPVLIVVGAAMAAGCGDSVPEQPKGAPKANPAMAESRIQEVMANPRFTQAQKDAMIATIKQKNHIQ